MTRAKFWIGLLATSALVAGSPVAWAQSPLSPAPMGAQPPAALAPAAPPAPAPLAPAPAPIAAPAVPMPPAAVEPSAAPTHEAGPVPVPVEATPLAAPVRKPKPKPRAPANEMAISDDPTPVLQPETFFATAKASEHYANIVDAGGWPVVPSALSPGARGPAVVALRRRLAVEGDLVGAEGSGANWSPALTAGVKRFQFRNGLRQSGVVAGATLRALNISARVRFKQLASSAQRLAGQELRLRRQICRGEPALDGCRRHPERPCHQALYRDRRRAGAPVAANFREDCRHQPQSDLDRAGIDHQERDHSENAHPAELSVAGAYPHPRRPWRRDQADLSQLEFGKGGQLHASAGFRRRQLARPDPHRHAQSRRGLHARHAVAQPFRQ